MIEYVVASNPDDRILRRASKALNSGELVCLPTDTNWTVVCDPFSKQGVDRLYKIRKASPEKHFSLLCDTISRASDLALISDEAFRIIKPKVPGHFTFIFHAKPKIIRSLKASKQDHEIGIRFPPNELVSRLIQIHGQVLLSANVTLEMLSIDDPKIEPYGYLIDESIGHQLALVIDPGEFEFSGSSTIVSFVSEEGPELLRQGSGTI